MFHSVAHENLVFLNKETFFRYCRKKCEEQFLIFPKLITSGFLEFGFVVVFPHSASKKPHRKLTIWATLNDVSENYFRHCPINGASVWHERSKMAIIQVRSITFPCNWSEIKKSDDMTKVRFPNCHEPWTDREGIRAVSRG